MGSHPKPQVELEPDGRVVPRYLDARDHPWLRALLDEYTRFADRPRHELDERLREPLPVTCPDDRLRQARRVLDKLCHDRTASTIPPPDVRDALFEEAARSVSRPEALQRAAERLSTDVDTLFDCLFADMPGERRLCRPPDHLTASELGLRVNLALVQSLLSSAARLDIHAVGGARDLVRFAHLQGLLCTAHGAPDEPRARLSISGPYALFRRTHVYARALGGLVPRLAWCDDFELRARCHLEGADRMLVVRSGDPVLPSRPPKRFDSKLERRFADRFAQLAIDWDLIREPRPIPVPEDDSLLFPDFELVHRRQRGRRWHLEIVGFWTRDYLEAKLRRFRAAGIPGAILCIDASRSCDTDDLPADAHVVRYRRNIDVRKVIRIIEG